MTDYTIVDGIARRQRAQGLEPDEARRIRAWLERGPPPPRPLRVTYVAANDQPRPTPVRVRLLYMAAGAAWLLAMGWVR